MLLHVLAVLSQMHYEGDVPTTGGDYLDVPFVVPAGTVEIEVTHTDGSDFVILDWGVWSPEGFRGWGGGNNENAVIGVTESSRSYLPGPITPGTWNVSIGKAKLDPSTGGHYSIDVQCRDTATLTVQPRGTYTATELSTERRWYKGDFHVHSTSSGDAHAPLATILAFAHSRGLDFVNISDHNTDAQLPLMAKLQPDERNVLMLRGAEITTYAGHGNAVGLDTYIDHRIGHMGRTIQGVLDDVAARDAIFIVNHPALELGGACIGCAWKHADTDWSKVSGIEVITGKWEFVERAFTPGAIAMWDAQLDAGHRIAAVGGSDDHDAGTATGATDSKIGGPTTLVLADSLEERAIIDAVKAGRTMVNMRGPDDPGVTFKLGDAEIGDTVEDVPSADLSITVTGGAGTFAQVWRDGKMMKQVEVDSDEFSTTVSDETAGDHRYRLELIDDGNQRLVVTSHIYATVNPADGCCQTGTNGTRALATSILVLGLLLRRRR